GGVSSSCKVCDDLVRWARHGRWRIVGMYGGQHEVTGECRLYRHLRGFQVAYLAHHDDVRVLPHQAADTCREIQTDLVVHLGLVERFLHHLDRVFDGADI